MEKEMTTLEREFKIIDAQYSIDQRKTAEITLLRILLKRAIGQYTSVHDTWAINDILEKYPEFADLYGLPPFKRII